MVKCYQNLSVGEDVFFSFFAKRKFLFAGRTIPWRSISFKLLLLLFTYLEIIPVGPLAALIT